MARVEISHRVGLTRGTVTRVTARLLEIGLLREEEPIRPQVGRPLVPLTVAGDDRAVGTVHFGAREVRVGLVGVRGDVIVERRFPNGRAVPAALTRQAGASLRSIVEEHLDGRALLGVGACIPGWVNPETGRVVRFDALGWSDIPLASMLAAEIPWNLHFDQMIRGVALAEGMFGSARSTRDFVELWLGDVIGASVVTDGVIRRGLSGASGLVGHVPVRGAEDHLCSCGRRGCLGSVASDSAVLSEARELGVLNERQGIRDLVDLAVLGRADAAEIIERAAERAGRAATIMVDLLDPSLVVVAGLVTEAPQFLPAFRSSLITESAYHVEDDGLAICGSEFGDAAPTIAAASIVLDAFYRDPSAFPQTGARIRSGARGEPDY